jgi:glycosyltransferase involved in cell wall biosynthesis
MRILVISPIIPFPPLGGGALRTFHLLRHLARDNDLTLIGFTCGVEPAPAPFAIRVIGVPWEEPALYREMRNEGEGAARAFAELANCEHPWFVSCYESPALRAAIGDIIAAKPVDLVIVEHTCMGQFIDCLPERTLKILDLHNVHAFHMQRETERKATRSDAELEEARTIAFEKSVCAQADLCLVCSKNEAVAAERLLGVTHIEVVPNGVDTSWFTPSRNEPDAGNLLFTGMMNYAPNVEAAQFFAQEIFPRIKAQDASAKFHIVGANPAKEIKQLASSDILVHGEVPDTRPFFQKAAVAVVPLLQGGGTRLKILEAAASGKAIVSTRLGAEGLDFEDGRDIAIADSASAFVEATGELLRDASKRRRLETHSRPAALRYDWEQVGAGLREILERCFSK